jgi:hypothetical protein
MEERKWIKDVGDDDDGGGLGVDRNSKIVWKSRLRDSQQ